MKKLLYLTNKGLKLYKKNLRLSISSIVTLLTIFFIYQFLFTLGFSVNKFFAKLSQIQNIRVYLNTDDINEIQEFIDNVKRLTMVESVKYYSKEDAYNYLKENTYNLKYLEKVSKHFFPSFVEVKVYEKFSDIKFISQIEEEMNKNEIVEVASYGEKWILKFASIRYSLQFFMLIVTILLSISVTFIGMNVINLNLYKFKDEIKIYNLVGATKSFIIFPFIIATVIEFFVSFSTSTFINIMVFYLINSAILSAIDIDFIRLPNIYIFLIMGLYFLLIAIGSTYFSSSKFLKKASIIND